MSAASVCLTEAGSGSNGMDHQLEGIASHRLVARAANALRHDASASPQLSATAELQRCQARMMEALAELRREPFPDGLIWRIHNLKL